MLNPGTASGIPLAQRHSDSLFQDSKKLTAMNALLLSHCEPVKKKTRLKNLQDRVLIHHCDLIYSRPTYSAFRNS